MFTLGRIYGNGFSVTRGKIYSYLGIDFNYAIPGTVQLSMIPYLKQTKDDLSMPITSTAPIPAADYLFQVRPDDDRKLLSEEQAQAFHCSTT